MTAITDVLKYGALGLALVRGVVQAVLDGKDLRNVRVADILDDATQLELSKAVADERAKQRFGGEDTDPAPDAGDHGDDES